MHLHYQVFDNFNRGLCANGKKLVMLLLAILCHALGSETTVIPLRNENDLKRISECLSCKYALMANVAVSTAWTPLGDGTTAFTGLLDGQGHTIAFNGFTPSAEGYSGFFGVMDAATIFDLKLTGTDSLSGLSGTGPLAFGLLAGKASRSSVYGCAGTITGTISIAGGTTTAGGLFGSVTASTVSRCYASTTVAVTEIATAYMGGLAGNATGTALTTCEVEVSITASKGTSVYAAGLVGVADSLTVLGATVSGSLSSHASGTDAYLGGIIGADVSHASGSVLISCTSDVTVQAPSAQASFLGGLVGMSKLSLTLLGCNAVLSVAGPGNAAAKSAAIGGAVGGATGDLLNITYTYVNLSLRILAQPAGSTLALHAGGLAGSASTTNILVNQTAVIADFSVTAATLRIGGLVAQITGTSVAVQNSGVTGAIAVLTKGQETVYVGGVIGVAAQVVAEQCYFIGSITTAGGKWQRIGILAADMEASTLASSFGVAFVDARGSLVTAGGVGNLGTSVVKGCYVHLGAQISTSGRINLGIMAGIVAKDTTIKDSFGSGGLSVSAATSLAYIGGFVGYVVGGVKNQFITRSYVWGDVSVEAKRGPKLLLGGFVGVLGIQAEVVACLTYVTMASSVASETAGLFAGIAVSSNPSLNLPAKRVAYSVAYIVPGGGLAGVKFMGKNSGITVIDSYCAGYPGTAGCTALATLNTQVFLKNFDFAATFQLSDSLANGSLALRTLPVPPTGPIGDTPGFVFPNTGANAAWPASTWQAHQSVFNGYPYLATIDYVPHCGRHNGCHGIGTSPTNTLCAPGWQTKPQGGPSTVPELRACNVFRCESDFDCSDRGTCAAGVCACASGYAGADCSELVCEEVDGAACGFGVCVPLAPAAATGVCQCQKTEYLTSAGLCTQGCRPLGFGVCLGAEGFACFKGYTAASGCLEYECATATGGVCNGKGKCTDGTCACSDGSFLIGGNCYARCTADAPTDCLQLNCGKGGRCSGHGRCSPLPGAGAASCVCNVDNGGAPTGTHFGGSLCAECQTGHVMHEGDCVPSRCPLCEGGTCMYDSAEKAVVCTCSEGQTADAGVCRPHPCGKCTAGTCLAIPQLPDPRDKFCVCNAGPSDGTCYELDCLSCKGGSCVPDKAAMRIQCVCPDGLTQNKASGACEAVHMAHRTKVIILCVVIIGGSAIIAAAVATGILVTRKKQGWVHPKPALQTIQYSG